MKTALITGASAGIGKETAYVYAENKYNLILVARRLDNLEKIKQDIEQKHAVKVTIIGADLSKLDSAQKLYDQVKAANISVDVLINNAGFGDKNEFKNTDLKRDEDMLILNIVTLTSLTKLFMLDMVERKNGHIINLASTAAYQPVPTLGIYAASKAYVLHFSEAIAFELKKDNVKVIAICPGATQSEFAEKSNMKTAMFKKAPTSRDLGEFIYKAMLKGKPNATHGFMNRFMASSGKFAPRKATLSIAYKMMN